MNNITIDTAPYGSFTIPVNDRVIKTVTGGLWYNGDIQFACYTRQDERAGYLLTFNCKTQTRKVERLAVSYISAESVAKYGRQCVKVLLPIF